MFRGRRVAVLTALAALAMAGCTAGGAPTPPTEASTQPTEASTQPTEAPTQPAESPTQAGSGDILRSHTWAGWSDEWVVYNKQTCKYEAATQHPAEYVAELRKVSGTLKIAYTPEQQVNPFLVAQNASLKAVAAEIGAQLTLYDNEYPSTTKPLEAADAAVLSKPDVVLSMNVIGDLYPSVMKKYNDACLPVVTSDLPAENAIQFGIRAKDLGVIGAEYAVAKMKQRNYVPADTWVVSCGDQTTFGTDPTSSQGRVIGFQDKIKELVPDIAADHYVILDCPQTTGPEESRVKTADFLTAHPDIKYLLSNAVNDIRAQGVHKALQQAGYSENATLVGIDADPAAVQLIKANDPIFVASVDQAPGQRGEYMIPVLEDVVAGRAVPFKVFMTPSMVDATNAK